jgi:hypothetical protein
MQSIFPSAEPHRTNWNRIANSFNLFEGNTIYLIRVTIAVGAMQVAVIGKANPD